MKTAFQWKTIVFDITYVFMKSVFFPYKMSFFNQNLLHEHRLIFCAQTTQFPKGKELEISSMSFNDVFFLSHFINIALFSTLNYGNYMGSF